MKYNKIIGTGGIGKGILFLSDKMEILGRSESRLVTLSPAKDYCKQQIVFYYIAALLQQDASIYPIGFVGNDENGRAIKQEMQRQGMNVEYIGISKENPTTLSICIQYPDKETCNITAQNSASGEVTPQVIRETMHTIGIDSRTIACAVPEVSVDSRVEMLKAAKEEGAFCVLSIAAAEAEEFAQKEVYTYCDLLSVNQEEAQAIARSKEDTETLIYMLGERLRKENPDISIIMTCGKEGAYSWQNGKTEQIPVLPGNAVNTTGAGDAFIGGTIAGLAKGLPLQKGVSDKKFGESELRTAVEVGTLCAGMAVECEDSIALSVTKNTLLSFIKEKRFLMSAEFEQALDKESGGSR